MAAEKPLPKGELGPLIGAPKEPEQPKPETADEAYLRDKLARHQAWLKSMGRI